MNHRLLILLCVLSVGCNCSGDASFCVVESTTTALPTPKPSASPSPSASVSPSATPGTSGVAACTLPPTNPAVSLCNGPVPSVFEPQVAAAQAWVAANTGLVSSKTGKVVDEAAYTSALAQRLRETDSGVLGVPGIGFCAQSFNAVNGGPTDEVWLKTNQTMSHHFDVVQANGTVWLKTSATCGPSRF